MDTDDFDSLIEALNTDNKANAKMIAIAKLLVLTGARPGEIMKAQISNIQLTQKITEELVAPEETKKSDGIDSTKEAEKQVIERGILTVHAPYTKTKKTRRIRLSEEAMAVIRKWMQSGYTANPQGYLFVSKRTGSHLTTVNKFWREFVIRKELDHIQMYSLRHTFATRALAAGVNIRDLQELLGHSDIRVTEGYTHYTNEGLSDAVESIASGIKLAA